MKDTTSIGDLTEFEIATALMRTRKRILRPLSAGLRYDLAIDNGDGTVVRVQCKIGILRDGFITFRVCNADARRPLGVPYRGQIEAFGVYCPQNGHAYLIPIEAVGTNTSTAPAGGRYSQRSASRHPVGGELPNSLRPQP